MKPPSRLGVKLSDETKKKMSLAKIGIAKGPLGFKQGEKQKEMTRQRMLGNKFNVGRKPSAETRLKMSNSHPRGILHPNWKGGISEKNRKIRNSIEMKLWRDACFKRDDYTCQFTGTRGGNLVVHHINNFADNPSLRTSVSNGITMSREAHIEFHKQFGRKNNTAWQLQDFLITIKLWL